MSPSGIESTWMSSISLICLVVVFFLTAVISVVTGGTSLITVPVMMQFGISPQVAVATNMVALIFLSFGGSLPFLTSQTLPRRRLPVLIGLTLMASALGALLLLVVPARAMPAIIATAMIGIALFALIKPEAGLTSTTDAPSRRSQAAGYVATFVLGIYGGFFSGGYVILLTAVCVWFFHLTFVEAIAVTKVLNLFSSLVAAAIFAGQGLIDWHVGLVLSVSAFAGGFVGSALASRMNNLWLRRIFLAAVIALALKTLLYDLAWSGSLPE